jgi:hypothetical protein
MLLFVGVQAKEQKIIRKDSIVKIMTTGDSDLRASVKDSMLMAKLSPDQLMQLEREQINLERERIDSVNHNDMPLNGFGIVIICLMPFLFVSLLIVVVTKAKNTESQRKYDLYTKSLEMGQTVPEHFFDEPKKANPSSNLKKGILWFAVGFAVLIYFIIIKQNEALIVGIVPTFVGLGYLLVHFLDKPKTDTLEKNNE